MFLFSTPECQGCMAKDLLLERCLVKVMSRNLQEKIQVLCWGTSSAGGPSHCFYSLCRCVSRSLREEIQVLRWGTSSAGGLLIVCIPYAGMSRLRGERPVAESCLRNVMSRSVCILYAGMSRLHGERPVARKVPSGQSSGSTLGDVFAAGPPLLDGPERPSATFFAGPRDNRPAGAPKAKKWSGAHRGSAWHKKAPL